MLTHLWRAAPHSLWVLCALLSAVRADNASKAFTLVSPAFRPGAEIPRQHTCDGEDLSPALIWQGAPPGTKSFALIADDPDAPAGTWVHWVLYNVPADVSQLAPGTPKDDTLSNGAQQGRNDFRKVGYDGPCPPPGKPHHYSFRLYALDARLNLKPRVTKSDVLRAMNGRVLGEAELIGTYKH
jgi:Raf kinase inhibitor-like YbhB/YbcL family protein